MSFTIPSPRPSRSPWQWFYGQAHALRRAFWARRAERLPRPVISVGNLSWGGSGKTPLTAAIAAFLRDSGLNVAILSRGYGSQGQGVRIVSNGQGPMLGPRQAGDEPVLLAGLLPRVAVVVCPDRARAGRHALERLDPQPDLFLLDDGFSHVRLFRDLDLLVFPADDPFAGARLLPGGRLREPLRSARQAHAVLLSGAPAEVPRAGVALAKALRSSGFAGPGFAVVNEIAPPRLVTGGSPPPGRALVVSGIARPAVFRRSVATLGLEVAAELTFGDHHLYPEESLQKIRTAFAESGASFIVTTGKDRVKLQGRLDLPLAEISLTCRPEAAFFEWLTLRLRELGLTLAP